MQSDCLHLCITKFSPHPESIPKSITKKDKQLNEGAKVTNTDEIDIYRAKWRPLFQGAGVQQLFPAVVSVLRLLLHGVGGLFSGICG